MASTKPPLSLFSPEELARLAERARLDVHAGVKGEPVTKATERTHEEHETAGGRRHARRVRGLSGLRVVARCYALARDPAGLTPIVWGTWAVESTGGWLDSHVDSEMRIATAVKSVGARVLEVPGLAETLARSQLPRVRLALARALPATSEPLLRALAQDDDAEVRKAARQKIADDDRWGGAFPIAPDGHPDEVLEAARRVLDKKVSDRQLDETVSAFAPLSDALAVACWERVLAPFRVGSEALTAWLACLLERSSGGTALARLTGVWLRGGHALLPDRVGAIRARLSEEHLARIFGELLRALRELETEERAEPAHPVLRDQLTSVACGLAPADGGDARALLEVILGCPIERASEEPPPDARDHAAGTLSFLLSRWPLDDALRAQLVAMGRAGKPGRWARVGVQVWDALGPDPVLREQAQRELDDGDESVRAAAVEALLGPLHDPSEDGDVESAARELYRRPALRAAVVSSAKSILPDARRDLEAGALDLETTLEVFHETPREERTDAMWAAARALRDRAMADPEDARWYTHHVFQTLIRGGDEWDPGDLAYARAIAERTLTDPDAHPYLCFLIGVLEYKESEESAALLREIDERATTDGLREVVQRGRRLSASMRRIGR